jgi:hypothetical protein
LALGKNVGSYQKNNKAKRAWGTTQVVEYPCLASVRLGVQTPVPQKKKKKRMDTTPSQAQLWEVSNRNLSLANFNSFLPFFR